MIHVVGPNRNAGETDRGLLVSCYTNALAVADELGVDSLAVPLVSAGVYGWPLEDAVAACVDTLSGTPTRVSSAVVVAFGRATYETVVRHLETALTYTPVRSVKVYERNNLTIVGFVRMRCPGNDGVGREPIGGRHTGKPVTGLP